MEVAALGRSRKQSIAATARFTCSGTPCTSATRRATRGGVRGLYTAPSPDFPPNAPLNNVATILLARGERSPRGARRSPWRSTRSWDIVQSWHREVLERWRRARGSGRRLRRRVSWSSLFFAGKADDDNDDGGALDDVLRLLDAAEPHAPPGSPLRERVLALRACAANRVPGRAALAAADLRDVLEHGAEHARDARRRGAALLELSRALQDDAAARRDALAGRRCSMARRAPTARRYSPLEARARAARACARARLELGLSPACDDAAGRWPPRAAAALGAGGARPRARAAGARPRADAAADAIWRRWPRTTRARPPTRARPCAGRRSGRRSGSGRSFGGRWCLPRSALLSRVRACDRQRLAGWPVTSGRRWSPATPPVCSGSG